MYKYNKQINRKLLKEIDALPIDECKTWFFFTCVL